MPTNKNAQLRYKILDRCFSDFHYKYTIEDLVDKVNESLGDVCGAQVSVRQIREDIKHMRDRMTYNAPIRAYHYVGKKCYYRYADSDFSIFNNDLSVEEVASLRTTIDILSRFRGIPNNAWLEEVISNLEYRFGMKPNSENIISFERNDLLKGNEFLGELIDAALNHQPLNILYRTFSGKEWTSVIHPYHLKQFNNRWFLIGLQEGSHGNYITNKALDRIVRFSKADVPFIPNKDIDFDDYFKDVIGVTLPENHPEPEEVLLKFDAGRFPYIINKPIHPSQVIVDETKHVVRLFIRPNKEFEACVFSYGNQVEVLKPAWLRSQILEKLEEAVRKYHSMENDPATGSD